MAFCANCGTWQVVLKPKDLCDDCFPDSIKGKTNAFTIQSQRKRMQKQIMDEKLKFYYLHYIPELTPPPRRNVIESLIFGNTTNSNQVQDQNSIYTPLQPNNETQQINPLNSTEEPFLNHSNHIHQNNSQNFQNPPNIPNQLAQPRMGLRLFSLKKSTIAIFFMIFGILLVPSIYSIIAELFALILAIRARRQEPPSNRFRIILIGLIIYAIAFIASIIIIVNNPEFFGLPSDLFAF